MPNERLELLTCEKLQEDVTNGLAMTRTLADVGCEHNHFIYLVKVVTGTDPTERYKPSGGSHFFKIRPNERDKTYNENEKYWDWYVLSCPHQVPCPFMDE